ncbi:MAG: winged helix-turn-helix domain-containing protein [bacterium]
MDDLADLVTDIALDLWHRFRAIALVLDQADRFVGMSPAGEAAQGEGRWLQSVVEKPEELRQVAEDLVLRAFALALQPANFSILQQLQNQASVSLAELVQACGLSRLSVSERVNDLIQVGLATKDVQTGQVQATKAAERVVALLQQTRESLLKLLLDKLPELL